jgi:hypothetical protein
MLYELIERIVRGTVGDDAAAWERRERFLAALGAWLGGGDGLDATAQR